MKKIKVYYIHSFNIIDEDEFFKNDNRDEFDLEKIKAHDEVQEADLPDFIYALNTNQIDSEGVFAYEEIEVEEPIKVVQAFGLNFEV